MNTQPYPARLDGRLDPALSRWLWLVKWLLAVPHLVVLFFLWFAVTVLTVVAGFAILFTGRYPRAIFDFNVGVMRWSWRVSFYAFNVLATDKYPPFSLQPDPSYPADFSVDYPQRLSRGLVLIKWWLLALPQYLIVAIFAGGWEFGRHEAWRAMHEEWFRRSHNGLHIVTTRSGHHIQDDEPQLVIEAIRFVLDRVRTQ